MAYTLTEIAGSAHLPTSTAHRLASELVAWRFLERTEERHYRIGLPLRIIASEYFDTEVCSTTQDRDAGAAGAARTVMGDPQGGAAGHPARLRCHDVCPWEMTTEITRRGCKAPGSEYELASNLMPYSEYFSLAMPASRWAKSCDSFVTRISPCTTTTLPGSPPGALSRSIVEPPESLSRT